MSGPITVTFVGGPEDGKRIALKNPPGSRRYRCAILPPLPTYVPMEEPIPALTFEQFEYEIDQMPGKQWVAYPADWRDLPNETAFERVMRALLRGYVGRG